MYIGVVPQKVSSGADWVNTRNIKALEEVCKDKLVIKKLEFKGKLCTLLNLIIFHIGGSSVSSTKEILRTIKEKNIDTVFLYNSVLGILAKKIKKRYPNITIITFFHNIEIQYMEEEIKSNPSIKNKIMNLAVIHNERLTCNYTDKFIVLNNRDKDLLKKYYDKESSFLLPTTYIDRYHPIVKKEKNDCFNMLFVGFAFYGNIDGLNWFINNVLPYLDNVKLTIVGQGMDNVFKNTNTIEVHGYVEDLSYYYYNCDVVILPILSGGGMKTKTAEAMMYGCSIIGTDEAFIGYEVDYEKIGGLANTKEDMIFHINRLKDNNLLNNEAKAYSRSVFLEKYDFKNTLKTLSENM